MNNGEAHNHEEINTNGNCENQNNSLFSQIENELPERALVNPEMLDVPVSDSSLYVSRIYDIYEKAAASNFDENAKQEAAQNIQERLEKAAQMLDEFQNKDVPEGSEDMNNDIIAGFDCYYTGLDLFAKYIEYGDADLAIEAFRTLYTGDTIMQRVQEDIALSEAAGSVGIIL
ncbi:MAG: hypothetical protein LWY06_17710 [Firmicutes bacterium]|nr:hypothetical protein [Bacillota bacterium]